jgi:hypothetical protein
MAIAVTLAEGSPISLSVGDTILFDGDITHRIHNPGSLVAMAFLASLGSAAPSHAGARFETLPQSEIEPYSMELNKFSITCYLPEVIPLTYYAIRSF